MMLQGNFTLHSSMTERTSIQKSVELLHYSTEVPIDDDFVVRRASSLFTLSFDPLSVVWIVGPQSTF